jgi:Rrf2 family protein
VQITRQADYAVRAVLYLAQLGPNARASTAHIAREQSIPTTFLAKIVSQLAAAGVVRATRGARGGVSLARGPEEISLLEIVEAIDGPVMLNDCVTEPHQCPLSDDCAVRDVWCDAQAKLVTHLAQTHFGQLVKTNGSRMVVNLTG